MAGPIDIIVARSRFSRLVKLAEAGHETVIARAGKPVAKLVPLATNRTARKLGALAGVLKVPEDFDTPLPAEDLATFERR